MELSVNGGAIGAETRGTMGNAGRAGSVLVEVESLTLSAGAQISSNTSGPGQGGEITITIHELQISENSAITSEASDIGNAGNIHIDTVKNLLVDHGTINTRAVQSDGGNLNIVASFLQLRDG